MSATFAPGKSPFLVKGNVYRTLLESADQRVEGGRAAVLERLEPDLFAFFAQPFLAASTYDALPIVPFGMAGARIKDMPYAEYIRGGAAFSARRDMHGIYKFLLKLTTPEQAIRRIPRLVLQSFNFGTMTGELTGLGRWEGTVERVPRILTVWLVNAARGFVPVVMAAAGARDVDIRIGVPQPGPVEHDTEMSRSNVQITWR